MKIRKAVLDDAAAIAVLTTELGYVADTPAVTDRLRRLSDRVDDVVFVAEEDGVIAGWIQAHTSVVLESGFRMEIVGLIVSDRFRRRGVGRLLVREVESWGREVGAPVFSVRSNVQRVESHAFYPALGYEKTKTQAVYRKRR
jgi:GNAT superfamily N-acetyltransferase